MSASNLAKVFGPTIVGNSSANVEPMEILQEAKYQPKVRGVGIKRCLRNLSEPFGFHYQSHKIANVYFGFSLRFPV